MKKTIMRGLLGIPLGISISLIISIIISLSINDGSFYPVVPELAVWCKSEINAVIVQYLFSAVYGAVWASASVIWDKDNWSLLRQTITHLLVTSVTTFPVAYLTGWMEHSIEGVIIYYVIFLMTYFMIWLLQYLPMKKKISQMNKKLDESRQDI